MSWGGVGLYPPPNCPVQGPQGPDRALAARLRPPVLPLLQVTASALIAGLGLTAYRADAALSAEALPGDMSLLTKWPSGQPPLPTPNLTLGRGRAES